MTFLVKGERITIPQITTYFNSFNSFKKEKQWQKGKSAERTGFEKFLVIKTNGLKHNSF